MNVDRQPRYATDQGYPHTKGPGLLRSGGHTGVSSNKVPRGCEGQFGKPALSVTAGQGLVRAWRRDGGRWHTSDAHLLPSFDGMPTIGWPVP